MKLDPYIRKRKKKALSQLKWMKDLSTIRPTQGKVHNISLASDFLGRTPKAWAAQAKPGKEIQSNHTAKDYKGE